MPNNSIEERSESKPDFFFNFLLFVLFYNEISHISGEGNYVNYFTKSDKVIFEIYDGGKEDGDRISVFVNDKEILSNYKANKEKKYFTVDVINDKTSVRIKAMNEGDIAPNTVVVRIKDKSNSIKALSNLKENDETQIDILKTKK